MSHLLKDISTELKQVINTDLAWQYRIIPKEAGSVWKFYVDNSTAVDQVAEELEVLLGRVINLEPIDPEEIEYGLNKHYLKTDEEFASTKLLDVSSDSFIENLIEEAKALDCSDIHLEPYEERCRVRMRLDGKLVERFVIEESKYPAYVNKLKIMSNLDIAEKRLPQDGRIFFRSGNTQIDIRVSSLPTLHGEKIVLRLLGSDASDIDINKLGFSENQFSNYHKAFQRPNGIILISGPTGSGKTTTLYATLKELNDNIRNILTIEDPIEYTLEGINQVQLKEKIGLDFATALRTFLRQDPDIIMVGEIRDIETAKMATRAALTGHLVLSTIHTNSALGIISRLVEMGVSPYLIADTLNVAVAQRLVRVLCPSCKSETTVESDHPNKMLFDDLGIKSYSEPVGCSKCYNTGYKGRKAIYEVVPIDYEIASLIKNHGTDQLYSLLKERNVKTLYDSALSLFKEGNTSLAEIQPYLINE